MRAMIVYGSPRGTNSASYKLASKFVQGLMDNGWEIDEIILSQKNINNCIGCYTCWTKTPGICVHKDDMTRILPKYENLDLLIIASPLYYYNVTGLTKDYIDRQLPLLTPYLVKSGDSTAHNARSRSLENLKIIIISVCGFPEKNHFDALSANMKKIFGNNLAYELYIPGSEPISHDKGETGYAKLYEIMRTAGSDYGKSLEIKKETLQVFEEMTTYSGKDKEFFVGGANQYWAANQPMIPQSKSETPEKLDLGPELKVSDKGLSSYFAGMAMIFNGKEYKDTITTICFTLDGQDFTLMIENGKCKAYKGLAQKFNMRIISSEKTWMDISEGKLDGQKEFMSGGYKIEGDMRYLLQMDKMFKDSEGDEPTNIQPVVKLSKVKKGFIKIPGMAWLFVGLLPWFVLWFIPVDFSNTLIRICASVLVMLVLVYRAIFEEATILEIGSAMYLPLSLVPFLFSELIILHMIINVFDLLFMSALWFGSVINKYSLTAQYSKQNYPESALSTWAFKGTNIILTIVWALYYLFLSAFTIVDIIYFEVNIITTIIPIILSVGVGIFTAWFIGYYPQKVVAER
jgi:putative sterol carrier protein/putative NADPH-quinone reductase